MDGGSSEQLITQEVNVVATVMVEEGDREVRERRDAHNHW